MQINYFGFNRLSFRAKLMVLFLLMGFAILVVVNGAFIAIQYQAAEQETEHRLNAMADILASQSQAALAFGDSTSAAGLLQNVLNTDQYVSAAYIYDYTGGLFAAYTKQAHWAVILQKRHRNLAKHYLSRAVSGNYFFTEREEHALYGEAHLIKPIFLDSDFYGAIHVVDNREYFHKKLDELLLFNVFVILAALITAILLALWLPNTIVASVLELAQLMKRVSIEGDYSIRAEKYQDDELGQLAEGFNAMLAEIAKRDLKLARYNAQLGKEVVQRTAELRLKISEREKAQEKLQEVSEQNRMLLETAGEGIFGLDMETRITFVNPAAANMLGFKTQELLGQTQHTITCQNKPENMATPFAHCKICHALQNGESHHVDTEVFWRRDGTSIPVDYIVTPLKKDGQIAGCVVTFSDITKRKQAEQALEEAKEAAEQANYAKSRFLANMSHELRTPLNAIIGYSEILQEDLEAEELTSFTPDLHKINSAATHLLGLINDVLDISKIEAEKVDLFLENKDVNDLIKEVLNSIDPLFAKQNNVLHVEVDTDIGHVNTDPIKLRQILLNLLGNAVKFTKDGTVTLQSRRMQDADGEWIYFAVIDTGVGMDAAQQEKVFETFTQVDVSSTRKYGGTGLGLAISKKFAEMLGGTLNVSSTLGEGSCFSLTLPASHHVDHPSAAANFAQIPVDAKKESVVIHMPDKDSTRETGNQAELDAMRPALISPTTLNNAKDAA